MGENHCFAAPDFCPKIGVHLSLSDVLAKLIENCAVLKTIDEHGMTNLHEAAANGDALTVLQLLLSGASVNAPSVEGVTPLMCAAAWGHVEVARILIEHGANIDLTDRRGATAYEIAGEKGENHMASFLHDAKTRRNGKWEE